MPHSLLLDLPAELLHHTVAQIDVSDDRPALYNLCLTSRLLRDVAQPVLFSHFDVPSPDKSDRKNAVHLLPPKRRLVLFSKTALQRSDLASRTKSMDLDFGSPQDNGIGGHILPEDTALFSRMAKEIFPYAPDWTERTRRRGFCALLPLIFCRLPNLHSLVFVPPTDASSYILVPRGQLTKDDVCSILPSLREVDIDSYGYGYNVPPELEDFGLFLCLPTLHHFRIDTFICTAWYRYIDNYLLPAPRTWLLSEVYLRNCTFMDAKNLTNFLAAFSKLKKFQFSAADLGDDLVDYEDYFTPAELKDALERQVSSLEVLDIGLADVKYAADVEEDDSAEFASNYLDTGSLGRFEHLIQLSIDALRLGATANLPPNIIQLIIRDVHGTRSLSEYHILRRYMNDLLNLDKTCPHIQYVFIQALKSNDILRIGEAHKATYHKDAKGRSILSFPNLPYKLYVCFVTFNDFGLPMYRELDDQVGIDPLLLDTEN